MDFINISCGGRYWFQNLRRTIHIPALKVKVTDVEFFMFMFCIKVFRITSFQVCGIDLFI